MKYPNWLEIKVAATVPIRHIVKRKLATAGGVRDADQPDRLALKLEDTYRDQC